MGRGRQRRTTNRAVVIPVVYGVLIGCGARRGSRLFAPSLLLADEPTGSLDPEMRDEALSLLVDTAGALDCATMNIRVVQIGDGDR